MLRIKKKVKRTPIEAEINFMNFGGYYLENEFQDYEYIDTNKYVPRGVTIGFEQNGRLTLNEGICYASRPRTEQLHNQGGFIL